MISANLGASHESRLATLERSDRKMPDQDTCTIRRAESAVEEKTKCICQQALPVKLKCQDGGRALERKRRSSCSTIASAEVNRGITRLSSEHIKQADEEERISSALVDLSCLMGNRVKKIIGKYPVSEHATLDAFAPHFSIASRAASGYEKKVALNKLIRSLQRFNVAFKPPHDTAKQYGFLEKKEVPIGTKIFTRADLHGDLRSLIEELNALKQQGFLDEQYNVKRDECGNPVIQLIFLGDYVDRGINSLDVLYLLSELKMANPDAVTLIRGNHENSEINSSYMERKEAEIIDQNKELKDAIEKFYETLPLATYVSQKAGADEERQYVQFSHGLFDVNVDISSFLESTETGPMLLETDELLQDERLGGLSKRIITLIPRSMQIIENASDAENDPVYKRRETVRKFVLSEPHDTTYISDVRDIFDDKENIAPKMLRKKAKHALSALRVIECINKNRKQSKKTGRETITTQFNWGDISDLQEDPYIRGRRMKLTPQTIKAYFRVVSTRAAKLKAIVRGHQHNYVVTSIDNRDNNNVFLSEYNAKIGLAHTLPAGSAYSGYNTKGSNLAYILTVGAKVTDWKRQDMERLDKSSETTISEERDFYTTIPMKHN